MAVSANANMLTNGDFETGSLAPWWTWIPDTANSTVGVVPGGPSPSAYCLSIYTNSPSGSVQVGQDVAFTAGSSVSLSLMYDVPAGDWSGAGITIQYKDAGWNVLDWGWVDIYAGVGGDDTGWVPFNSDSVSKSGNWTAAPAGTAYLSLKIEQWGWQPAGSSTLYDNVVLTPEPATMILLGIGGLVALRRKHA